MEAEKGAREKRTSSYITAEQGFFYASPRVLLAQTILLYLLQYTCRTNPFLDLRVERLEENSDEQKKGRGWRAPPPFLSPLSGPLWRANE